MQTVSTLGQQSKPPGGRKLSPLGVRIWQHMFVRPFFLSTTHPVSCQPPKKRRIVLSMHVGGLEVHQRRDEGRTQCQKYIYFSPTRKSSHIGGGGLTLW